MMYENVILQLSDGNLRVNLLTQNNYNMYANWTEC